MKIERYRPGDTLAPFIKAYMIIESETGMENRILPDQANSRNLAALSLV